MDKGRTQLLGKQFGGGLDAELGPTYHKVLTVLALKLLNYLLKPYQLKLGWRSPQES